MNPSKSVCCAFQPIKKPLTGSRRPCKFCSIEHFLPVKRLTSFAVFVQMVSFAQVLSWMIPGTECIRKQKAQWIKIRGASQFWSPFVKEELYRDLWSGTNTSGVGTVSVATGSAVTSASAISTTHSLDVAWPTQWEDHCINLLLPL